MWNFNFFMKTRLLPGLEPTIYCLTDEVTIIFILEIFEIFRNILNFKTFGKFRMPKPKCLFFEFLTFEYWAFFSLQHNLIPSIWFWWNRFSVYCDATRWFQHFYIIIFKNVQCRCTIYMVQEAYFFFYL